MYALFLFFLLGMLRYPGLIKAFFYEPFVKSDYSDTFFSRFCLLLDGFMKKLEPLIPENERSRIRLSIAQITASTVFIGIFPGAFRDFLGYSLSDPTQVREYMTHMLKQYAHSLGIDTDDSESSRKQIEELADYYFQNM